MVLQWCNLCIKSATKCEIDESSKFVTLSGNALARSVIATTSSVQESYFAARMPLPLCWDQGFRQAAKLT